MKFKVLTLITLAGFVALEANHKKSEKFVNKNLKQKRYIREASDYISNLTLPEILAMVALVKISEVLGFCIHGFSPEMGLKENLETYIIFSLYGMPSIGYRELIGLGAIKGLNYMGRKLARIKDEQSKETKSTEEKAQATTEEKLV